ncbi:MAG: AzlD domain-containing protein [Rhizobiales bacterium]|nr:AzlD domain-containing protein [Hyphomicrobiales bacterium]
MVEPWIIILALPFVIYFTRTLGIVASDFIPENSRIKSTLSILPICAILSFFIPAVLKGSPYEIGVSAFALLLYWFSNNAIVSMIIGIMGLLAIRFVF